MKAEALVPLAMAEAFRSGNFGLEHRDSDTMAAGGSFSFSGAISAGMINGLGDGTAPSGAEEERKLFPIRALLSRTITQIDVGGASSCAVTTGDEAYCWGWATGNPVTPVSDTPVRVGG